MISGYSSSRESRSSLLWDCVLRIILHFHMYCLYSLLLIDLNGISEKFQSGFKLFHSTETALLRFLNDLLLTVDSGNSAVLVLLDLTAAFDTVDHNILLSHLNTCVGIRGTVLKWFRSHLSDRSFSVQLVQYSLAISPLSCGVPQGFILGPLLFFK